MSPNNAIVSYALLGDPRKEGQSYIDRFIPFVILLFREQGYESIAYGKGEQGIEMVRDDFKRQFGLAIPHHPMEQLLRHCVNRTVLTRKDRRYRLAPLGQWRRTISERKKIEQDIELLSTIKDSDTVSGLSDLCSKFSAFVLQEANLEIGDNEAEEIILNFLNRHYGDLVIFAQDGGAERNGDMDFHLTRRYRQYDYLFNRFVFESHRQGDDATETFQRIVRLAWGYALYCAISLGWEDHLGNQSLRGCHIYLDTRMILRLLGIEGEYLHQAYHELLRHLLESGATLHLFEHTKGEIDNILNRARDNLGKQTYKWSGGVERYFRSQGMSDLEIVLFIERLNEMLREFNIGIEGKPSYDMDNRQHQINELELKENIKKIYKARDHYFDPVSQEAAIDNDVDSISAIYRLRRGNQPTTIQNARYLFVTTNGSLPKAVRQYNKNKHYLYECLTDTFLGTALWILSKKRGDDFEKLLLGYCQASIELNDAFVHQFRERLDQLKKRGAFGEEEYRILLSEDYAMQYLYRVKMGIGKDLQEGDLHIVLDEIRNRWMGEERAQYAQNVERLNQDVERFKQRGVEQQEGRQEEQRKRASKSIRRVAILLTLILLPIMGLLIAVLPWYIVLAIGLIVATGIWRLGIAQKIANWITESMGANREGE